MCPLELLPRPGSPEELARFASLQAGLARRFLRFRADPRLEYTVVVVPSQSFDPGELAKILGVQHYEERSLFHLMLLQRPRMRVVFVTSKRLDPLIIDYYLHQMRGVPAEHARARLVLLDCDDGSARPLSWKLLERPRLLRRIREAIPDREMTSLAVFNSTPLERTLAVQLGIPLNGCDPELTALGSKTGARRVFRAAGVPLVPGREGLRDVDDLAEAIVDLWEEEPRAGRIVAKLDESFSGEGNALLDLRPWSDERPSRAGRRLARRAVEYALHDLEPVATGLTPAGYRAQFDRMGGVCELWIDEPERRSPSVQLRTNPVGETAVVSTHDQVLAGPGGQVFVGATFPACAAYRGEVAALGRAVGAELAGRGVIGRYGVDFLALPGLDGGPPRLSALEINLRQGGTTHPFNTLKLLTAGSYDEEAGVFRTAQGVERCYFATDSLSDPAYRGTLPVDLIDAMVVEGVHFRADETGVVFHLLGCLSEFGKIGCLAVAPSVEEARGLYRGVVRLLDRMCGQASPRPEPQAGPAAG